LTHARLKWISQSPITASPSVIARPGTRPESLPPAAYYIFRPKPDIWSTQGQHQDLQTLHWFPHTELNDPAVHPSDEHDLPASASSDSDNPSASRRENRPPLCDVNSRASSSLSVRNTDAGSRSLCQLAQLATQLTTTMLDQLKCTREEAAQREQRMSNEIAERKQRLLNAAIDRERAMLRYAQCLRDAWLADAQQTRETEAQRDQRLLNDAQLVREQLLADAQQREIDLRRDLYDLAHERARTAALETELKYLKASAGPATIAYEVVPPVQNDDIASPAVDVGTDVQVHFTQSASLVDTPVDNTAVLSTCFAVDMTQPSTSVHAPDIAYAFLQPVRPHAADTYTTYSSALQPLSTLQPPPTLSIHGTAARRSDPAYMQHQSLVPAGPAPLPQTTVVRQPNVTGDNGLFHATVVHF